MTLSSIDTYQYFLQQEKKSEGAFTQTNWELFKQSAVQKTDAILFIRTNRRKREDKKIHHRELMKVLLGLKDAKLDELLELYKEEFGVGAARYARQT